uniref:F-box domain-containing protein n=1 Tax=Strongyloides stercoralis TaxID=6248 RepID=A0A0K0E3F2_STRER
MILSFPQNSHSLSPIEVLPVEILINIFSKIEWKSLINIKKTCKRFHIIVENNLKYLQKPKLRRLFASSIIQNESKIKVEFTFHFDRDKEISINEFNIDLSKTMIKTIKIDYLLERMDLNKVQEIFIDAIGDTIIFDILNRHFPLNFKIRQLYITIKNCPVFQSFVKFLKKINSLKNMYIKHLCFGDQKISSDYIFPNINGIKQFYIKECPKTKFFNIRMLKNLLNFHKNLDQITILSELVNLEFDMINIFRNKQTLKHKEKCEQDYFSIILPYRNPMSTFNLLKEHYNESTLIINEDIRFHNSIYVTTECIHCEVFDYIHFLYLKPERYWEECC